MPFTILSKLHNGRITMKAPLLIQKDTLPL
jgi:hypothetical protein